MGPSDPFEPFHLPTMPGVPMDKVACFTGHTTTEFLPGRGEGHRAPRTRARARTQLSDAEIVTVMATTLPIPGKPISWADLGYGSRGLALNGKEVELRRLWDLVQEQGGFSAVCAARKWSALATALGADISKLTNGASIVKAWYLRFFMTYEQTLATPQEPTSQGGAAGSEFSGKES